jgi:competence protein ComEC
MEKNNSGLKLGLVALLGFAVLRTASFTRANSRRQLIVYNIPQKQAFDLIEGRKCLFVGDSNILADDYVRNFHIKPSRTLHRIVPATNFNDLQQRENLVVYRDKKIFAINRTTSFSPTSDKIPVDLLLVSGNPKLYFNDLVTSFLVKQVVFDGSCPAWKINYWKKDCDSLHIPFHDVNEKGAFVMNLR